MTLEQAPEQFPRLRLAANQIEILMADRSSVILLRKEA